MAQSVATFDRFEATGASSHGYGNGRARARFLPSPGASYVIAEPSPSPILRSYGGELYYTPFAGVGLDISVSRARLKAGAYSQQLCQDFKAGVYDSQLQLQNNDVDTINLRVYAIVTVRDWQKPYRTPMHWQPWDWYGVGADFPNLRRATAAVYNHSGLFLSRCQYLPLAGSKPQQHNLFDLVQYW